jgi:hypothetical protein
VLPAAVEAEIAALAPRDLVVGLLTWEHAATAPLVAAAARAGLAAHFPEATAALVNADAGSSDGTPEHLAAAGLPLVRLRHEVPAAARAAVPHHGVPGRDAALRAVGHAGRRLGARALVVLEADVTSAAAEWMERLARPVWDGQADLVLPVWARPPHEGVVTALVLAPLARALFGRRVHQPWGGALALSRAALERLEQAPAASTEAGDLLDFWLLATASAGGGVREAWLGPHRVESRAPAPDIGSTLGCTVGALFRLMDLEPGLWLEVRRSRPAESAGAPAPAPTTGPRPNARRMLEAFRRGRRDLLPVWEHVLAPETLGEVLALDDERAAVRFPDPLWARVVYDFALGYRFRIVDARHLLRALTPLFLGRAAAWVLATGDGDAAAAEAAREAVGLAFEREKAYLTERWS